MPMTKPMTKPMASQIAACRPATGGIWPALLAYVEGRSARLFERERRQTYQTMPQALQPGTFLYDRRADGSILQIKTPSAAQAEASIVTWKQPGDRDLVVRGRDTVDRRALESPARTQV